MLRSVLLRGTATIALTSLASANDHKGKDHDAHFLVSESCLSKTDFVGEATEESMAFDHTALITEMLEIGMTPYSYSYCLDSNGLLASFQLTYANESAEETFVMPRAGPELGTCTTEMFEYRGSPDVARIFLAQERVIGLGILHEDRSLPRIKLGKAIVEGESAGIDMVDG